MFSCLNESIAASAENSWFNSRFQCKRSRREIAVSLARTTFWRGTRRSVESIVKLRESFSLNAKQRARRPSVGQKLIPNRISYYLSTNNIYNSVDVVQLAALTTRNLQKNQIKKTTKPTEWTIRRSEELTSEL